MKFETELIKHLELGVGFLRPAELGGKGNFYVLGAVGAEVVFEDGTTGVANFLGREKIQEVKKGIKEYLGKQIDIDVAIQLVDKEKVDTLIKGMVAGISKAYKAKKINGVKIKDIKLCPVQNQKKAES